MAESPALLELWETLSAYEIYLRLKALASSHEDER